MFIGCALSLIAMTLSLTGLSTILVLPFLFLLPMQMPLHCSVGPPLSLGRTVPRHCPPRIILDQSTNVQQYLISSLHTSSSSMSTPKLPSCVSSRIPCSDVHQRQVPAFHPGAFRGRASCRRVWPSPVITLEYRCNVKRIPLFCSSRIWQTILTFQVLCYLE